MPGIAARTALGEALSFEQLRRFGFAKAVFLFFRQVVQPYPRLSTGNLQQIVDNRRSLESFEFSSLTFSARHLSKVLPWLFFKAVI
ncbi:hypothetical protein [Diaphorobacter caeni]|uniref:hypothetical protein n=1 Tax=Diaphorobacter caeni TaxID=2784387 RepID=UPI00188ED181|nr:hypothetical protein [Diaphorobacter caeni]MBF5005177.1 hypothetical protein [Diaphorobacter caeni]